MCAKLIGAHNVQQLMSSSPGCYNLVKPLARAHITIIQAGDFFRAGSAGEACDAHDG
jgi:hypothetical protein